MPAQHQECARGILGRDRARFGCWESLGKRSAPSGRSCPLCPFPALGKSSLGGKSSPNPGNSGSGCFSRHHPAGPGPGDGPAPAPAGEGKATLGDLTPITAHVAPVTVTAVTFPLSPGFGGAGPGTDGGSVGDVTGGALIRQDVWAPPQQRHRQEEEEEEGGGAAFIPSGSVLGTGRAKPGESQGMSGFGFFFSKEKRSKMNLSQKGPNSRGLELGGTRLFCSHGGSVRVQTHHFWWKSGGLALWEHPALPQVDPCGVSKSWPGIPGLRGAREGLNPSVIPKNQTNKPGERECPAGGEAKRGSDGKRQARGRAGSWNPIIPGKAINLCQPRSLLPLLLLLFPAFPRRQEEFTPGNKARPTGGETEAGRERRALGDVDGEEAQEEEAARPDGRD